MPLSTKFFFVPAYVTVASASIISFGYRVILLFLQNSPAKVTKYLQTTKVFGIFLSYYIKGAKTILASICLAQSEKMLTFASANGNNQRSVAGFPPMATKALRGGTAQK
jgi:hypothetical protein